MGNRFQSHLVPMDVKFKGMDVVFPEQLRGPLDEDEGQLVFERLQEG